MYTSGRSSEAEAAYRDALALWTQLADAFPAVAQYQNGLAGTLVNLAMVHNQRREFAAALQFLEQARPHHQAALKASPKNSTCRLFYRNNLRTLAQSQRGLADHVRLAAAAEELARFGYDPANDSYLTACFLCHCATLAGKDARLDEATQGTGPELRRPGTDARAASHARGYKDAAQIEKGPRPRTAARGKSSGSC